MQPRFKDSFFRQQDEGSQVKQSEMGFMRMLYMNVSQWCVFVNIKTPCSLKKVGFSTTRWLESSGVYRRVPIQFKSVTPDVFWYGEKREFEITLYSSKKRSHFRRDGLTVWAGINTDLRIIQEGNLTAQTYCDV
ncbi:hypothetical protein TNCV_4117421 [Trichonephila clavipes]|nr:hypothetical protein TNCV_4117421 [Trichonephila clavipes]